MKRLNPGPRGGNPRQCLITPSCGMGSLTPDKAEAILKLLREVSDRMQKTI
jgi:hypothetical protein